MVAVAKGHYEIVEILAKSFNLDPNITDLVRFAYSRESISFLCLIYINDTAQRNLICSLSCVCKNKHQELSKYSCMNSLFMRLLCQ